MTNREVIASFTNGREGRAGHLRSEHRESGMTFLYSYHMLIAVRLHMGSLTFVTTKKRSVTTSRHTNMARNAARRVMHLPELPTTIEEARVLEDKWLMENSWPLWG